MAAKEKTASPERPILLVGSGRRPREIGAVLGALAAVRAQGGEAVEPFRPLGLGDLEDLLARRPEEGTLILEDGRVPGEDIGFVRRFLERHPGWRLLVVGDDPQHPVARVLLALPHTQWLPWPPDLDVLAALLSPAPGAPPPGNGRKAPRKARRAAASAPRPAAPAPPSAAPGAEVDVGSLLEELLADAALAGEGAPRYLFRCDGPVLLSWDRGPLSQVLLGLLALARRCAGEEGVVSAQVDPPDGAQETPVVRVRIDFPPGPLTDVDLPGILEGEFSGDPSLAEDVAAARAAAELLRRRGGSVHLAPHAPDRLRLELHLPQGVPGTPAPPSESRGSAEDPFA